MQLTKAGRTLMDQAVPDHLANEASMLHSLTPAEMRQLERLLRKLQQGLC